jgi:hypothetical protein
MDTRDPEILCRHRAWHEAGHAIASLVYGYRFPGISIRPGEPADEEESVWGSMRGRARDLAVIRMAGIIAAARMGGYDPWEDPPRFDDDSADIAMAREFIDNWAGFVSRTYGETGVRERVTDEADRTTRQLVEEYWIPIVAIADALMERETLAYAEIVAILKERCPGFPARDNTR